MNDNGRSVSSRTLSARVGSINASDNNRKRGMVLPFTPLSITFDEIRYAVDMPQVHELSLERHIYVKDPTSSH